MTYTSKNPSTGETLESFPSASHVDIERALVSTRRAFESWRTTPVATRTALLREVAARLRANAAAHAQTMALEMGKPVVQGEAEIEKCAATCVYYADHAERMLAPEPRPTEAKKSFVRFDPIGSIFAVMPWNFPFWQVIRFAAPTIAAGNAAVLKHAPNVPRCALAIEQTFRDAGAPEGLFTNIFAEIEDVPGIIGDPRIAAVTLTGSERAGASVAELAGRSIKKAVLELGGNDPLIVLADADVEKAAKVAADARLINSGQSCIAAKRFIVVEAVAEKFTEAFVAAMKKPTVGDPLSRGTNVGPQAREDLRANLHRQVVASVERGAKLALGGVVPPGAGAFYPPTVLTAVGAGMPAFDEETFGPAAAVVRAKNDDDAIDLANQSPFGLGASLWTNDRERAENLAARIESGTVFVNAMVKSDARMPFGGIKRSGIGRELSELGMHEFVNIKSVWIE